MKKENKFNPSNKELICMRCGFCTFDYRDMVEHLAQSSVGERMASENCEVQTVKYGRNRKRQRRRDSR